MDPYTERLKILYPWLSELHDNLLNETKFLTNFLSILNKQNGVKDGEEIKDVIDELTLIKPYALGLVEKLTELYINTHNSPEKEWQLIGSAAYIIVGGVLDFSDRISIDTGYLTRMSANCFTYETLNKTVINMLGLYFRSDIRLIVPEMVTPIYELRQNPK
jgi:hypothetical protein